jgi:DNA-directed RNA polymerase subunit RPC12/RpoP
MLSPAIGGMKLMVQEPEVVRAKAFLDQVEAEYLATIPCTTCGQKTLQVLVKTTRPKNFIAALLRQLFVGTTEQEQRFYRCSNCGATLEDVPVGEWG